MANWPTDYDELNSPADGDKILVTDVSETTVGKKVKWWTNTGLKAFLKTYFDALYLALVAPGTSGNVLTSNGTIWTSAAAAGGGGDWTTATGTWSYSSADAPTFVASENNDQTAIIYPGQRLSLTQTTEKFFIVTAVGAYSGGNTLITMYGGTDYTLTADAITTPKWSNVKIPSRFPMSPAKWTETLTDTTDRSQLTSGTTIYNLGSLSKSVPIGIWQPFLSCQIQIGSAAEAAAAKYMSASISTANNTINKSMYIGIAGSDVKLVRQTAYARFSLLTLAAKTTYYFTAKDDGGLGSTIYALNNASQDFVLSFVCAYL